MYQRYVATSQAKEDDEGKKTNEASLRFRCDNQSQWRSGVSHLTRIELLAYQQDGK